jgi:hypothetical protein
MLGEQSSVSRWTRLTLRRLLFKRLENEGAVKVIGEREKRTIRRIEG